MSAMDYAQSAYRIVIDPHVETAIWAIILAIACALVIVIAEMVKQYRPTALRSRTRTRPKKPDDDKGP